MGNVPLLHQSKPNIKYDKIPDMCGELSIGTITLTGVSYDILDSCRIIFTRIN